MPRLPRVVLVGDDVQLVLDQFLLTGLILDVLVQTRLRVRLRRFREKVSDLQKGVSAKLRVRHAPYLEARLADEIVARELIPIQQGQLYPEGLLVPPDVEEQLLVPDGVERMADDTCAEDLLAK